MKTFLRTLSFVAGFVTLFAGASLAQHEAMYSQYMFNGLVLNPAYAGSSEALSATALYRRQWINIEGAPVTQTISVHAPIAKKKVGIGLSITNDKIGITSNLGANGTYAYRIITNRGTISMGLQLGISQFYANYTTVQTNPQNSQDNTFSDVHRFLMFNLGSGAYYYTDKFYAGFSVPYLHSGKIAGLGDSPHASPHNYRHYFLTTGYVFTLNDNLKLKPSTIVKMAEGAPVQVDVNTNLWFYNRFGVGLSYRTGDSMVGLVEFQISNQFRFGYAYDRTISQLGRFTSSSHELMLRFDMGSPDTKFISPRFF